jgi:hypothetical protein
MDKQEAYERLSGLALDDRLQAVADDVESRRDEFRAIAPRDLADLLEVPAPEKPDGNWTFCSYVQREPLSEYVKRCFPETEVIYLLEGKVPEARFDKLKDEVELVENGEKQFELSILSAEEQKLIEECIMQDTLNDLGSAAVIANYSVKVPKRERDLSFEATIEDDGACIDLLTPYDDRDGRFVDLEDCAVAY